MFYQKSKAQKITKYFSVPLVFRRGFTLAEIIIVIGILLVITVMTVQGFSQYSYRQVYIGFVSEAKDNLVEVRQKTIASFKDTVYGVYVGTSTIEFFPGVVPEIGSTTNTIMKLTGGITATSSFSTGNWYTTFLRGTGASVATGTITFMDERTGASTTITIHTSGLIE